MKGVLDGTMKVTTRAPHHILLETKILSDLKTNKTNIHRCIAESYYQSITAEPEQMSLKALTENRPCRRGKLMADQGIFKGKFTTAQFLLPSHPPLPPPSLLSITLPLPSPF